MTYILDSDILIRQLANDAATVELITQLASGGLDISMVTYMEAYQGTLQDLHPSDAERRFETTLAGVTVLPFSAEIARRCARMREELKRQKKRVRSRVLDLIIAATALEHDLILVTRNVADYQDIPDVRLY